MATIQKTQGIALLPIQSIASNGVAVSGVQDVSTALATSIFIHLGRNDTGGDLTNGVDFRVEASAKDGGNDQWFPLATFRSNKTVPVSKSVNGTVSSATRNVSVTNTANIARGDIIFIQNSTLEDSEFHRVKAITPNTTVHIIDALTNAQTGSTIYDQAEMYVAQLDLSAIGRLRLVVDASGSGRSIVAEAFMVTGDSIS